MEHHPRDPYDERKLQAKNHTRTERERECLYGSASSCIPPLPQTVASAGSTSTAGQRPRTQKARQTNETTRIVRVGYTAQNPGHEKQHAFFQFTPQLTNIYFSKTPRTHGLHRPCTNQQQNPWRLSQPRSHHSKGGNSKPLTPPSLHLQTATHFNRARRHHLISLRYAAAELVAASSLQHFHFQNF